MFSLLMAGAEFISASTAGIVYVMLGFVPDFVIMIQNHGGTNPNIRLWVNGGSGFPFGAGIAAALGFKVNGADGVITRDTTSIDVYAGGDLIATTETADTAGKHVDQAGAFAIAGAITQAGISIPADNQTDSGRNVVIAFRMNRGTLS